MVLLRRKYSFCYFLFFGILQDFISLSIGSGFKGLKGYLPSDFTLTKYASQIAAKNL